MEESIRVRGEYVENFKDRFGGFYSAETRFTGVLKGDWIYLDGCNKRKKASGKHIKYAFLDTCYSSTMFQLKKHPEYIFDDYGDPWRRLVRVVNCDRDDVPNYIWQKVFQKIGISYREELDGYEEDELEEWMVGDLPWYERPMVEQMDSHVQLYRWHMQMLDRMSQSSFQKELEEI